jgi:hypothetical protein
MLTYIRRARVRTGLAQSPHEHGAKYDKERERRADDHRDDLPPGYYDLRTVLVYHLFGITSPRLGGLLVHFKSAPKHAHASRFFFKRAYFVVALRTLQFRCIASQLVQSFSCGQFVYLSLGKILGR